MSIAPITTITLQGQLVDVLRLELAFPDIEGNKHFKLKYNLSHALEAGYRSVMTFGGNFSNHVYATAYACKQLGLHAIFILRGEDDSHNPTLKYVRNLGMETRFISRDMYKMRNMPEYIDTLAQQFGRIYILPEGGTNDLAVKGCAEILTGIADQYDQILCPVGTGGTLAGLINTPGLTAQVTGVSALTGGQDTLTPAVQKFILPHAQHVQWKIMFEKTMGKYAQFHPGLHKYLQAFVADHAIKPDPVYTGKMFYFTEELLKTGNWNNQRILCVHTGGLQGWAGWQYRYANAIARLN